MKKISLMLAMFFAMMLQLVSFGQIYEPVRWSFSSESLGNNEYNVIFSAKIENGWYVYSQNIKEDLNGPLPTTFYFNESAEYERLGGVLESKSIVIQDPIFDMKLPVFEKEATFTQKVKVLGSTSIVFKGEIEYMACNDGKCLPPTLEEFEIALDGSISKAEYVNETASKKSPWIFVIPVIIVLVAVLLIVKQKKEEKTNNKDKKHEKSITNEIKSRKHSQDSEDDKVIESPNETSNQPSIYDSDYTMDYSSSNNVKAQSINGYIIINRLGEGGMAEVYYAENKIGKKAAIKFLKKQFCFDQNIVERFYNEAKVMVALDHPNIRQVLDYDELDGQPAIIQEYLEGNDLKSLIKSGKHFSDAEMIKLWNDITDALNYTHSKGVVHRDIKPSNIFITDKGVVKILDFGIAKIKGAVTGTQTGQKMGTLIYMSPEQIKDSKHIDYKTDVYSLAVTFVHILKGKTPYDDTQSSEWEIMNKIVSEPLDMNSVPENWRVFLIPYLAKNPNDRPTLRNFTTDLVKEPKSLYKTDETIIDNL